MSRGKFSDVSHNILKEYLEEIEENIWPEGSGTTVGDNGVTYSSMTNSMGLTPKHYISAGGGFWTNFFIKTDDEFLPVKMVPMNPAFELDENYINVARGECTSMVTSPTSAATWEAGSEIYLRNDSYFHDWWNENKSTDEYSFFNHNKYFAYIGKIYPTDDFQVDVQSNSTVSSMLRTFGTSNTYFHIEFNGFKDWAEASIPEHQRTNKMKELFYVWFDQIYTAIHNKTKDLWSNLDPLEINSGLLWYLALSYNVNLNDDLSDQRKREFIRDIIHFLKRKGSYTSLYIIWYLLTGNTVNRFNVYERWHDFTVTGNPLAYFDDHMYQSYYNVYTNVTGSEMSLGAGREIVGSTYYNTFNKKMIEGEDSFYDYWFDLTEYPEYNRKWEAVAPSAAAELSPHYRVELDLSDEPLEYSAADEDNSKIMGEDLVNSMLEYWEMIRPVSRFSHYNYILGLPTNLTGNAVEVYTNYKSMGTTEYCKPEPNLDGLTGTMYHKQSTTSTTWEVYHELGTKDIIVQCFDLNFEQIEPSNITSTDTSYVTIEFNYPISGWAFVIEAGNAAAMSAVLLVQTYVHAQGEKLQLSQHMDSYTKFLPENVELTDASTITTTVEETISNGRIVIEEYDYIWYQDDLAPTSNQPWQEGPPEIKGAGPHGLGASSTWVMQHNNNYLFNIIQFFDENDNMIYPDSVTIVNTTLTIATFDHAIKGYALFKILGNLDNSDTYVNAITYYKIGNGTTEDWDGTSQGDLESVTESGGITLTGNIENLREDDSYYYIDVNDTHRTELNITEVGLFNSSDEIVFYSKLKDIYKPDEVDVRFHYKVKKLGY